MKISEKLLAEITETVETAAKRLKGINVNYVVKRQIQDVIDVFKLVKGDDLTEDQIWLIEKNFTSRCIKSTSIGVFKKCVKDISSYKNFPTKDNYNEWIRKILEDVRLIQADIDKAIYVHEDIQSEGIARILRMLFEYQTEFPSEFDKSLYEIWSESFEERDQYDEHDDSPIHFKNECQCFLETGLSLFEYSWIIRTDHKRVLALREKLGYTDILKK